MNNIVSLTPAQNTAVLKMVANPYLPAQMQELLAPVREQLEDAILHAPVPQDYGTDVMPVA